MEAALILLHPWKGRLSGGQMPNLYTGVAVIAANLRVHVLSSEMRKQGTCNHRA